MSKVDEERRREVERMANDPNALDEVNQRVIADFRANQGKVSGSVLFEGMPVLLMTMTGAKSGRTLTRPVCYSRDGDTLVVIASYGVRTRTRRGITTLSPIRLLLSKSGPRSSGQGLPSLPVRRDSDYSIRRRKRCPPSPSTRKRRLVSYRC
jgi:hypothetical protein